MSPVKNDCHPSLHAPPLHTPLGPQGPFTSSVSPVRVTFSSQPIVNTFTVVSTPFQKKSVMVYSNPSTVMQASAKLPSVPLVTESWPPSHVSALATEIRDSANATVASRLNNLNFIFPSNVFFFFKSNRTHYIAIAPPNCRTRVLFRLVLKSFSSKALWHRILGCF